MTYVPQPLLLSESHYVAVLTYDGISNWCVGNGGFQAENCPC